MKSVEVKFNEAVEALKKVGKLERFTEQDKERGSFTIESKLNLAETILQESHIVRKQRGDDNGSELLDTSFSEGYKTDVHVKDLRELQVKSYMLHGISEADARKVLGLPPKDIEALGRHAAAEYAFARGTGLSEADATRLAKKGR